MIKLRFAVLLLAAFEHNFVSAIRLGQKNNLNAAPQAPHWPSSYETTYIFTLPYTAQVQDEPVSYKVYFARDGDGKSPKVRMDTLDGTNVLIAHEDIEYELIPRLDRQVCRINKDIEAGEGQSSLNVLPAISDWEYRGNELLNGEQADLWVYERRHEAKIVSYKFYISSDGTPLRLHMHGNDAFSGAHFDEWIADYIDFKVGRPDPEVFDIPELCKDQEATKNNKGPSAGGFRMKKMAPTVRYGGEDAEYDQFLLSEHGKGRIHANLTEYRHRMGIFKRNSALIAQHNAAIPKRSFTMSMNKFGDWTKEEFVSVMLPRKKKQQGGEENKQKHPTKHELPYEPLIDDFAKLPSSVDWRGTGADSGVKDQANCGSCWAFGAVGAMESAWFHATGTAVKLSEQQVMDCSWGFVPGKEESASSCDGGDAWAGIGHIVDAGGIANSKIYPYLGQSNYCYEDSKPLDGAKFKGYARIPQYNDTALMEAVYSRGPLAVSLDASQDSFTFYSSGIYYDTACMYKPEDLDHSQMLMGYGSNDEGDYWIVKNSWSANWGDNGYVLIARDGGGCGAATDAVYAVADVANS